jgi:asparagine synthase (glutamine-hydrolysing)
MDESPDMQYSKKIAEILELPLVSNYLDDDMILDSFGKCHEILKLELLKVEILVPAYCAAAAAAKKGHEVMLFGAAAEELFIGYERFFTYAEEGEDLDSILREEFKNLRCREINWISKICRKNGIEARFPFYNQKLEQMVSTIPVQERMSDRELKKPILREAAKMLGVPEMAISRRKHAMQYGSGIHKVIMRNADSINEKYYS